MADTWPVPLNTPGTAHSFKYKGCPTVRQNGGIFLCYHRPTSQVNTCRVQRGRLLVSRRTLEQPDCSVTEQSLEKPETLSFEVDRRQWKSTEAEGGDIYSEDLYIFI